MVSSSHFSDVCTSLILTDTKLNSDAKLISSGKLQLLLLNMTSNNVKQEIPIQFEIISDFLTQQHVVSDSYRVKEEKAKRTKKWTWKKTKGKPCRPTSAYNFFFKCERQ